MTILSISCNWYVVCSRFFYWRQELHLDNLLDTHNIYFGRIENFLEGSEVTEVQFFIKKQLFGTHFDFKKHLQFRIFSKVFHVSCNIFWLVRFELLYVSLPLRSNLIQHFRYPQNVFWMCRKFFRGFWNHLSFQWKWNFLQTFWRQKRPLFWQFSLCFFSFPPIPCDCCFEWSSFFLSFLYKVTLGQPVQYT